MALAARERADELESIGLLLRSGRRDYALKTLDERGGAQELVRQQYTGRYPFELLQNANDAAREGGVQGRARFVLTDTALLVADNGSGFGAQQIKAICSLGRSSKGPGTAIGHKGLGFKSVGEITERPQIVSSQTSFQFDADRVRRDLLDLLGELPARQRFPVYAFPYPVESGDLDADTAAISSLQQQHFTTVVRLPLREGVDRELVAEHLAQNLHPRLLLFLPNVDHLELRGTDADFSAEVARHALDGVEQVLLETETGTEEWLVYRGALVPSADVLEPMGEAWAELDKVQFAVGVPMEGSQPRVDETFPLHVYFPTEERPGLHVAVHAEWALTMDRRRVADTPEAVEFNRALLDAVTDFAATTVAPDLVTRCGTSATSVQALIPAPAGQLDGAAAGTVRRWKAALANVPFLPFTDGHLGRPAEVRLLPTSLPHPELAHDLATLPGSQTLRPDVEAVATVRQYITEVPDAAVMGVGELLAELKPPTADKVAAFYTFLVGWRGAAGIALMNELKTIRSVLTTNGHALVPADQTIFFPRRDASVPDDIPVPIASLPAVDGLEGLLRDLGVRNFDWRDLIRDYLVKILEREDADQEERARAMAGLRAYQRVRRANGEEATTLLGRVLVEVRNWDGSKLGLRRADQVYFGNEWTGSNDLEEIYGPFGRTEFLAVRVPTDSDARHEDLDFYRMLGVLDHPRLNEVAEPYTSSRHPHAGPLFTEWLSQPEGAAASRCPQEHERQRQQLTLSYRLDRHEAVIASGEPRRLVSLWNQLALHWGKVYQDGMRSVFRCTHGWHTGEKDRPFESLFAYTLRSRAWVPVELGGTFSVVPPNHAWVETTEPPPRIRARIPRISETMHRTHGGTTLTSALGLIEAGRPKVDDLLRLLGALAVEAEEAGTSRDIELAARWVQRMLEDALSPHTAPHPAPEQVRLLATHQGKSSFVAQPPFADDLLLRDTWARQRPVLSAEAGLTRLTSYFGLVKLDDAIDTTPIAFGEHHDAALDRVHRQINAAKPYVFALVTAENSRAESRVRPALRRLELVLCDRLVLRYSHDGLEVEREDATCFIAARQEWRGRRPFNVGTAYLELDARTREPDWYAMGQQLAQHLGVAGHADAITLLLKGDRADRDRMMANRQIPDEAVVDAREQLRLPLEDEQEPTSVLDAYLSLPPNHDGSEPVHDDSPPSNPLPGALTGHEVGHATASGSPAAAAAPSDQPPPVDYASVRVEEATPATVDAPSTQPERSSGTRAGSSSAPSLQTDAERRRVGKRGEEIVYVKERERIAALGMDPDSVFWRSRTDELAPVDIHSFDADGQRIHIEVKSTTSSDPSEPFYISAAELVEAGFHGSRYYIYRVTDVDTATPRITRWANPMQLVKNGCGRLLLAKAHMELGLELPGAAPT